MPKRRYEILLPLRHNDGRPMEAEQSRFTLPRTPSISCSPISQPFGRNVASVVEIVPYLLRSFFSIAHFPVFLRVWLRAFASSRLFILAFVSVD